jgi:hypothetical protein
MNMLCLGWRDMTNCGGDNYGRTQQLVPPCASAVCPDATWFYVGLAVIAGIALVRK